MPRVERDASVTLVTLVYRSLKWLDFVMDGVDSSRNITRYRWLVVANDATPEVKADPRISVDFENEDPSEFYIPRVYRAWNAGVLEAPTQLVVMTNSDMYHADYWLDELVAIKKSNNKTVPTSLLVESGKVPSGLPEFVRNFGMNPDEFQKDAFRKHAATVRQERTTQAGGLYMPILVDRQEFADIGMYPPGNPPGTTGDKDLIRRYQEAGFQHVTALGSVVYHCVQGEQGWP